MPVAGLVDLLGAETLEAIGCAVQAIGLAFGVTAPTLPDDAPLAFANNAARMIGRRSRLHVETPLYSMLNELK
jgi:hypothetical protein